MQKRLNEHDSMLWPHFPKIDDSPLNVARSFFGIRSDCFDWED